MLTVLNLFAGQVFALDQSFARCPQFRALAMPGLLIIGIRIEL